MENGTEPASRFNSERAGNPGTAWKYWRKMGWDGREGNGRGEKGSWARAHPGLHVRAARCVTTRCAPAARQGRRSPSTRLRAPPHRVQERPPARPPTRLLSAPPTLPAPAPRVLAPPPGAERKRAAADLPRWHRSHKPARNCKANKAEILDWSQS